MELLKLIPIESFLTIITSLVATIFALTLKITDLKRTLKHTEDDLSSARTKFKVLDEKFNKEISDIKELHVREMEEVSNRLPNFDKDNIHTADGLLWRSNDKTPFCLSCYEVNGKLIHMHFHKYRLQHGTDDLKWECPNQNCRRSVKYSSHPNIKD